MGKEATIGLAVILILLITFGVVLVRRLSGSTDPVAAPSVEQSDKDSSRSAGRFPKGVQRPGASVVNPEPRPLTPETRTLNAEPRTLRPEPSRFAVASDGDIKPQGTSAEVVLVSPPSMMPHPPAAARGEPQQRPRSTLRQMDTGEPRPPRPLSGAVAAGGSQPYDPFQSQMGQPAPADTAPVGQSPGGLRSLGPPRQMPRQGGTGVYEYRGPEAYSGDPSAARQTPAWRQPSPSVYPPHAQQVQPLPLPETDSQFGPPYAAKRVRNASGEYEVQPNDSYWVISQKLYGSGAYFKALAEHNRGKVPREDRLDVGMVISAPDVPELEKAYPDLCPKPSRRETVRKRASLVSTRTPYVGGRTYVVEEGDTLFDIARHLLGKASRWVEIQQLNRDLVGDDPDYISPGMQLVVPDDEPSERVTQRPRPIYPP
jgi:nucleoid-associated protein YgaU